MTMVRETLDDILVSLASKGKNDAPLPPHLWEPLRIRLQKIYRNATGEAHSVVSVENIP